MIFPFRKQHHKHERGPVLKVDLHSHLIPGIDDGAKCMDESLELLRGLAELGYQKVITTPHIMCDMYGNSSRRVTEGLHALREAAHSDGIVLEIDAAAEYYLDEGFMDELESGEILSICGEYLLFESSCYARPLQMEEMIFAIGKAGYKPLLAHPERYRYIIDPRREYERFKELGVFFQINVNSFGGHYGQHALEMAEFLSRNGMIDFLGSDIHHRRQLDTLKDVFETETYHEIFKYNDICNDALL